MPLKKFSFCGSISLNREESNISLYVKLNFDSNIKEYLQLNTNKEKQNIITQFGTLTDGLQIEINQYKSPPFPYTKQKCNDINDEIHMQGRSTDVDIGGGGRT